MSVVYSIFHHQELIVMNAIWNVCASLSPQITMSALKKMVAAPIIAMIWRLATTAPALPDTSWRTTRKHVKVTRSRLLDDLEMHFKKTTCRKNCFHCDNFSLKPFFFYRHWWVCWARHLQSDLHQPAWQLQVWLWEGLWHWSCDQNMQSRIR